MVIRLLYQRSLQPAGSELVLQPLPHRQRRVRAVDLGVALVVQSPQSLQAGRDTG